jgi:hypothetical protein
MFFPDLTKSNTNDEMSLGSIAIASLLRYLSGIGQHRLDKLSPILSNSQRDFNIPSGCLPTVLLMISKTQAKSTNNTNNKISAT